MARQQKKKNDPITTLIAVLIVLGLLSSAVKFVFGAVRTVLASVIAFTSVHWPLLLCCAGVLAVMCILLHLRQVDRALKGQAEQERRFQASLTDLRRKAIRTVLDIPLPAVDTLSGENFEAYVQALFIALGYSNVVCTQLSNDYGVDVIAELDGQRYGIQCKRYTGSVGREAVQQVVGGLNHYSCTKGIVITNSSFTANARVLARDNDVLLIDRKELNQLIEKIKALPLLSTPAPAVPKRTQLLPRPAPTYPTSDRSRHWGILSSGTEPLLLPAGRYQIGVDLPIGAYRLTSRGAPCGLRLTACGQRTERSLEADSNWCLTAQHGSLLEVSEPGVVIERVSAVRTM